MKNPAHRSSRVQTTISVLNDAIDAVDQLAVSSGVSRSRLMDLAIRRFLRWAVQLDPRDLQLIAEYEVTEPISGFVRRPTPPPMGAAEGGSGRAKALSSSQPPPARDGRADDVGPITPRDRTPRLPEDPRSRDSMGRYSDGPTKPTGRF